MKQFVLVLMISVLVFACKKTDNNPAGGGNVPISTGEYDQEFPRVIPDGSGNAIIVWSDKYIHAQKLNKSMSSLWNKNGVIVTSADDVQKRPVTCSDGSGGVIVAWDDYRNGQWPDNMNTDIYIQRLNNSGNPVWNANGVALTNATGDQIEPSVIPDGAGGAIVAWQSGFIDIDTVNIYIQKINQEGITQWNNDGIPVSYAMSSKFAAKLTSDGNGGAIVAWIDKTDGETDIYAQRVNQHGEIQWGQNGVIICSAPGDQWYPEIVSDGSGGAIIVWSEINTFDIYAQRIDNNGIVQWAVDGIPIVQAERTQEEHQIISDGQGNVIVIWTDYRSGIDNDIYAQKINNSGMILWDLNGVVICDDKDGQENPHLTSDGEGGAFITWETYRNYYDVFAQRVNSEGTILWSENGVAVCTENETQWDPKIVSVGDFSGAIIVWVDFRNDSYINGRDIFADYISAEGVLR